MHFMTNSYVQKLGQVTISNSLATCKGFIVHCIYKGQGSNQESIVTYEIAIYYYVCWGNREPHSNNKMKMA